MRGNGDKYYLRGEKIQMKDNLKGIYTILEKDSRLLNEEGKLLKNKIHELALKMDSKLIKLLATETLTKDIFFTDIDGILVFDKNKFTWVINSKDFLPDSYTAYKNDVLLTDDRGTSISNSNNVVLSFPFKDCVLEGGQSKDEEDREEIFYNEILGKREIDILEEPKVLNNIVKYSDNGKEEITFIDRRDNLIIKGNNYIALNSLLSRYNQSIKCIFIDVPYNTKNDSFRYNDTFNQSTWLTFMKNRLSIAKKLLKSDGSIALYIDNNEIGYLQVLMDEIFGKENRAGIITVKRGSVTGHKAINPGVVNVSEYIMIYCKDKKQWKPNKIYRSRGRNERYNNFIKNRDKSTEEWEFCSLLDAFSEFKGIEKNKLKKVLGADFEKEIYKFVMDNSKSVIQFAYPDSEKVSQGTKELIKISKENPNNVYIQQRENELDIVLKNGQRLLFYSDRLMFIDGELTTAEMVSDFWDDVLPNDLASEGNVKFKKGKKPEKAIKRILELLTNKDSDDIVLDFFMGSGTMPAVAHKMGLQYIGIEQMDYIQDISVERLLNVINGTDKKGVSKALNWKGGGSFVYCELANNSQHFIDKIVQASEDELPLLYDELKDSDFISYRVDINELENQKDGFIALSDEDKRKFLINIIDKNTLYINYSEMNDASYNISDDVKAFNNSFYKKEV